MGSQRKKGFCQFVVVQEGRGNDSEKTLKNKKYFKKPRVEGVCEDTQGVCRGHAYQNMIRSKETTSGIEGCDKVAEH